MDRRNQGFTLVELLVTMTIIAILAGAALPIGSAMIDRDREIGVEQELELIAQGLTDYYYDFATFPPALDAAAFLGRYVPAGVRNTTIKDAWGGDVNYRYVVTNSPDSAVVYSRGADGIDQGSAAETLQVTVDSGLPGNRHTRERMRVIVETLANFLETGGTLTGNWSTDRVNLGLGVEYQNDGFGTAFTLNPATLVLRSAGADRQAMTPDDLTS